MMDELTIVFAMQAGATLLAAGLYVVILRKAGFNWFWAMVGLAPVLASAGNILVLGTGFATLAEAYAMTLPLGLLPLLLLAFGRWPRLAAIYPRSETFQ